MADNYNSLNARIKLATTSTEDFTHAQRELMRISQYTGSTFESNAGLFSRVSSSLREYGYSTQDILSLTDALATGLQVSGASAEETSSLIVQLSQALGRGVLRGQDFNSVAQSGQRIMKALSDGLGVAQKDLKQLADAGELTTPKIVPALIGQLKTLHDEFDSMPNSVSAASTRVTNAFQQWVGEANKTTAVTATLSGVLDGVAKNMDTVAAAGGILVAVGAARFFGGMVTGAVTATGRILETYRAEVALADAQVRGTQIATARARAAVYRAQRALVAAQHTDKQALAETRLAQAQARLSRNIDARTAAQDRLNKVTSLGSRLMGGALGLIGGLPGLAMLAGSALYYLHQSQEQAKQSALELGKNTDLLIESLKTMNSLEIKKRIFDTQDQVSDQKKAIEAQTQLVEARKMAMERARIVAEKGVKTLYSSSPTEQLTEAIRVYNNEVNNLAIMQAGLGNKQRELNMLQASQTGLLRDNYVEMLNTRDILPMLTLAGSDFNKVLSAGNRLLQERMTLTPVPFALPPAPLDDKQKDFLNKSERDLALSTLQGEARVKKQAEFAAEDQGLNTPQHRDNYQKYINNAIAIYQNGEKAKAAQAAASKAASEAAKAAREAAKVVEDYASKVAELNTQLATEAIRYKDGNAAAELFAASQGNVTKFTKEQNDHLNQLNQRLAETKQRYQDLQAAIDADPFRNVAKRTKEATEQLQRQNAAGQIESPAEYTYREGEIWKDEVKGNAEASQRYAVSADKDLLGDIDPIQDLENQLERKKALYQSYADSTVISEQRKNELILAAERDTDAKRFEAAKQVFASQGDLQSLAVTMFETTQERMGNMVTGLLTGTKSLREGMSEMFASLAQDVIKSLVKMAAQALITNTIMKGMGSMGGGGMFSGFTSLFTQNAKGGVYTSANLSQYSGQIVSSPTLFAFAKGAGLMGEAGPEAIMPLARTSNGNLGVRLVGANLPNSGAAPQVHITIHNEQTTQTTSPGWEQFGSEIGRFVEQRYRELIGRDLGQGGILNRAIKGGR
ncbi:phage tail tape measure protein [Xenorhabdus miraniensis]|nr:tape measure protein [Xenorhabdus miraniensis]